MLWGTNKGDGFIYKVCSRCGNGVSRSFSCMRVMLLAYMQVATRLNTHAITMCFFIINYD